MHFPLKIISYRLSVIKPSEAWKIVPYWEPAEEKLPPGPSVYYSPDDFSAPLDWWLNPVFVYLWKITPHATFHAASTVGADKSFQLFDEISRSVRLLRPAANWTAGWLVLCSSPALCQTAQRSTDRHGWEKGICAQRTYKVTFLIKFFVHSWLHQTSIRLLPSCLGACCCSRLRRDKKKRYCI